MKLMLMLIQKKWDLEEKRLDKEVDILKKESIVLRMMILKLNFKIN